MQDLAAGVRRKPPSAVVVDPDLCSGCRTCELACSMHHSGSMSPELSSVRVHRSNRTAVVDWRVLPTCDLCAGEEQPWCTKYCHTGAIRIEAHP